MTVLGLLTVLSGASPATLRHALLTVVVVLGVLAMRWPVVAVLGAILVSPTFGWATAGPTISPFQLLVVAAIVGVLVRAKRDVFVITRRVFVIPSNLAAAGLVTLMGLSAVANPGSTDPLFVRSFVGALAFLLLITLHAADTDARQWLIGAALIGCTVSALVGLVQLFTIDALVTARVFPQILLGQGEPVRLPTPWGLAVGPWSYGKDVLVGLLLASTFWRHGVGRAWGAAVTAASLFLTAGLLMSGNRSALLGGAVAGLYLALRRSESIVRVLALVLVALCGLVIARPSIPLMLQEGVSLEVQYRDTVTGAAPGSSTRVGERSGISADASNSLRVRLTVAGLGMIADHPLLGVGPGGYRDHVDSYEPVEDYPGLTDERARLPAHNVLLEIGAGMGLPALFAYLAFLGAAALTLLSVRPPLESAHRAAVAVAAALGALFITSLFHNYHYDNDLWLLAGIAAGHRFHWHPKQRVPT